MRPLRVSLQVLMTNSVMRAEQPSLQIREGDVDHRQVCIRSLRVTITVKIDQSFMVEISTNGDAATFLRAVISMCKTLKKRVVAEGVEKREQLTFLQAERCSEGQGYYFSPAVDAEHFAQLLGTGKPDFETPVA